MQPIPDDIPNQFNAGFGTDKIALGLSFQPEDYNFHELQLLLTSERTRRSIFQFIPSQHLNQSA